MPTKLGEPQQYKLIQKHFNDGHCIHFCFRKPLLLSWPNDPETSEELDYASVK